MVHSEFLLSSRIELQVLYSTAQYTHKYELEWISQFSLLLLFASRRIFADIQESIQGPDQGYINLHFRGLDIKNVEPGLFGLGRSDPFFEISKKNSDHASGVVRWYAIKWIHMAISLVIMAKENAKHDFSRCCCRVSFNFCRKNRQNTKELCLQIRTHWRSPESFLVRKQTADVK